MMRNQSTTTRTAGLILMMMASTLIGCGSGETPGSATAVVGPPSTINELQQRELVPDHFLVFDQPGRELHEHAVQQIETNWQSAFVPLLLEAYRMNMRPQVQDQIVNVLQRQTGQTFGHDLDRWWVWWWSEPRELPAGYAEFKARLYFPIDQRFAGYFVEGAPATIRLDEVRWGGVRQDGIPPLRDPKMIDADDAMYLDDSNIVFGIEVNGDVRAYPKRILAWHELFTDTVGGIPVAGVYCTLCGSMILYETRVNGVQHQLGTSGFLYRSNKLMYDRATQSLWNTLHGEPVIGELVGRGIKLPQRSVVTTTWGEWKQRHPDTTVLSLKTGHSRDYSEGAAYRDYFSHDWLMFAVPQRDERLNNKDEVLALRLSDDHPPLAIDAAFLKLNPVYHDAIGETRFVVLTDASGANRVYEAGEMSFAEWDQRQAARDETGTQWTVAESALTAEDGRTLPRLPAHRAFWFGWHAQYPDTRLVK